MNRPKIYEALTEMIPELQRRECTPRVMAGADVLLDALCTIQANEELEEMTNGDVC